nr:MAG TPA: hypothetical protein [Caudoviricetes sp.]
MSGDDLWLMAALALIYLHIFLVAKYIFRR